MSASASPQMRHEVAGDPAPESSEQALSRGWKSGFIFFARYDSLKETFERRVFGLPSHKKDLVAHVEPASTALFVFDQTFRYLHGVYEAAEAPGFDIDPQYLRGRGAAGGDGGSPFPVQVRFAKVHDFTPLTEHKFCHLLSYNAGTNIFRHRLNERTTADLLKLLAMPEDAPADNVLPYESNGYVRTIPENPRFREQRRAAYGE